MNYSYTSTTKPGKSDPYWYEWSVGEKYLLDMLYEESNIEAVAFQGNISLGLDDVVVYYKDEFQFTVPKAFRVVDSLQRYV